MQNADGATGNARELVEYYYGMYTEQIAGLENTIANLQIQITQAQSDGTPERQQELQGQLQDYQNQRRTRQKSRAQRQHAAPHTSNRESKPRSSSATYTCSPIIMVCRPSSMHSALRF